MTARFDTKDPRETVVLTFDATRALASGEILQSVTNSTVTVDYGSDASP